MRYAIKPRRVLGVALFTLLLGTAPAGQAEEPKPNFAEAMLADVKLGEPIQADTAILVPLVLPAPPAQLSVGGQFVAGDLTFAEPEIPSRRYDVVATNLTDHPVLVLGGTVLVGGERDRIIRNDRLIGPGGSVELAAWPAADSASIRREPIPFSMAPSLAPLYLRRKADYGGSADTVLGFIARNLEFRDPGVTEKSLAALGRSKVLESATEKARSALATRLADRKAGDVVVGAISAIRGRVQSLVLFGSPDLLTSIRGAYLKGATYAAAALSIQAEKKGIPIPGKDDPAATLEIVRKEAAELLEKARKARYKPDRTAEDGTVGEHLIVQIPGGARGRAVGLDGHLVFLTVYPHDPFESAIYGSRLELPDEEILSDPDRIGLVELGRKAETGRRLTEAETRLLRGLRGGAPRSGPGGRPR